MNPQYKKGVLELCVLSLLRRRDRYGYEISEYLAGHIDIADGTVYPLLRKMKADGLVTTYLQEESGGPPQKYYKLTQLGEDVLPSLPIAPQFSAKARRRLRTTALIALALFAACFVLAYVVCALSAGSLQFWHVWGWFVN